jgi:hypothetical protein
VANPSPFTNLVTDQSAIFNSSLVRDTALPPGATVTQLDNQPLSTVSGFKELSLPWYSDQVLPFDVTLAFTNEYGSAAACKIYAIELLNEGYGISIDDAVSEMQATFVARGISPLQAAGQVDRSGVSEVDVLQFATRVLSLGPNPTPLARGGRSSTRHRPNSGRRRASLRAGLGHTPSTGADPPTLAAGMPSGLSL